MRCPRCQRESGDPAPAFCPRCGAPLVLPDDAPPAPIDAPVSMDRRAGGERRGGVALGAEARVAPDVLADGPVALGARGEPEGSGWVLGRLAAAALRAEPLAETGPVVLAGGEPAPRPLPAGARSPAPSPRPPSPATATAGGEGEPRGGAEGLPARAVATVGDAAAEPAQDLDVEVDAVEVRLRRPATWRRVLAWALDGSPFAAVGAYLATSLLGDLPASARGVDGLLDLLSRERVIVLSVAATVTLALAVYATLSHALAGATLGKRLLGLRVVGPDGARPSLGRSAARAALAVLSGALLGLGFQLALFTRSGRALHDLGARTWVVEAP